MTIAVSINNRSGRNIKIDSRLVHALSSHLERVRSPQLGQATERVHRLEIPLQTIYYVIQSRNFVLNSASVVHLYCILRSTVVV